jgi:hypothetical protein
LAIGIALVVATSWLILLFPGRTPSPEPEGGNGLGIQELVRGVKEELSAADAERRQSGEAALFKVKDFDLEVSFFAHSDSKTRGGFQYHVLTLDREQHVSAERVQKLHLRFQAVDLPPGRTSVGLVPDHSDTPVVVEGPLPPKKIHGGTK